MTRKKLLMLLGSVCLALILVMMACAAPAPTPTPTPTPTPAPAQLEPIEIKLHCLFGITPGTIGGFMYPRAKEIIEKATLGRAEVTLYPSCQLVPFAESYRGIQEGIADCGWIWQPATPGAFPLHTIFELPGLAPNQATSNVVLTVLTEMYPQFDEEFSPKVKNIISNINMRADLHSRMPIRTLADMSGKIIATHNEAGARALSLLGASPTVMPMAEQYSAADKGIIDGGLVAWGSMDAWKLYEVYKYHTLISVSPGASNFCFNRDTWNKFIPAEQAALELAAPRFANLLLRGNVIGSMSVRQELATPEQGHEYIVWSQADMDKMREVFKPVWDEWVKEMEAKGIPAQDILDDAVRYIDGYVYG